MEVDHLFILVRDGCAGGDSKSRANRLSEALGKAGLSKSFSRIHRGQGTANHRFQFDNVMLELLYIHDRAELSNPPTTALQLEARFQNSDASPFGVCSRPDGQGSSDAAYQHSLYEPVYLPAGLTIQFANELPAAEPLWFHLPFADRPESAADGDAGQGRAHPSGLRRVIGIRLEVRQRLSIRSASIADQLGIEITNSGRDHMHLSFEPPMHARTRGRIAPHKDLPLSLEW